MEAQVSSKKETRNLKKEAIFDAAMKVFLEKGYEEARIIDIATEAGIGKGTVYEYFSSKEELFFELFCGKMEEHAQKSEMIREMEGSPEEQLRAFLDMEFHREENQTLDQIKKCKLSVDVILGNGLGKNKKISEQIHLMIAKRLELLEEIIKRGISKGDFPIQDSRMAAISTLGSICFAFAQYQEILPREHFSETELDSEKIKTELCRFILKGLSG